MSDWQPSDYLDPEIRKTVEQLLHRHPAFLAHERFVHDRLAELAIRAFRHGAADALLSLKSSREAADELGISISQVQRYAKRYELGWQTGRDVVLRPDDVQFIQERLRQVERPKSGGTL